MEFIVALLIGVSFFNWTESQCLKGQVKDVAFVSLANYKTGLETSEKVAILEKRMDGSVKREKFRQEKSGVKETPYLKEAQEAGDEVMRRHPFKTYDQSGNTTKTQE